MRCALLVLFLVGCGHSGKPVSQQVFHLEPNDDVGDVVSGAPTAPQSPGMPGPTVSGGTGAGGGTPRPKGSVVKQPTD